MTVRTARLMLELLAERGERELAREVAAWDPPPPVFGEFVYPAARRTGAHGRCGAADSPEPERLTEEGVGGVVAENLPAGGRAQKLAGGHSRTPAVMPPSSVSRCGTTRGTGA
jgi:hypothetical protein